MGAVWRGSWHGGLGFTAKCVAPISIPIGTQQLHAVGAAMAAQRLGEDSITVAFLGDGATSAGDVHEALNLASLFATPCVFYVQNNQWAISVPVGRQVAGPSIAQRAEAYGMPGVRVDGNDVLACYAVMAAAAERARRGDGPTLIEAVTHRMGPHTTSDDPTRYRDADELEQWAARDPISRYRTYLQGIGGWTERLEQRVAAHAARLRTELRDAIVGASDPDVLEMFDTVYADITPELLVNESGCEPSWRGRREMTQIFERPPLLTSVPTATNLTMVAAINRALHDAMATDDRVLVFGEDVARLGGVFRVTDGLSETFGESRCFDTPLAESAIIGIAIGMAVRGMVPVPEIQFDGFSYPGV